MSTPQQRIEADVKLALKAGEKEKLSTLRMLLAELKNEKIRIGADVDEAGFTRVVQKAIKQRREAAESFRGQRPELEAKELREAESLSGYLPQQASEAEIRAAIEEHVRAAGLAGPAAIGPVMRAMIARFGSQAEGSVINRLAREVLTGT